MGAFDDPNAASGLATYRSDRGLLACGSGCFEKVNGNGQTSPLPAASGSTGWVTEESSSNQKVERQLSWHFWGPAMNLHHPITRRDALKRASALAMAVSALEIAGPLAWTPERASAATRLPDIQFDIEAFLAAPPQTSPTGVIFQMPPVHTVLCARGPAQDVVAGRERLARGGGRCRGEQLRCAGAAVLGGGDQGGQDGEPLAGALVHP